MVKFWVIENYGKPLSSLSSGLPNVHHKSYLDVGCNNYLGPLSLSHLWCPPDPLVGREEARTGPHTPASSGQGVGGIQVMISRINCWTQHCSLQSTLTMCAVTIYYVARSSFCHVQFYFQNVKVLWLTTNKQRIHFSN